MLQRQEYTPVKTLADQLGISKRQVERMLAGLGELGIPLESLYGRGYRMAPQPNGMPVHLTSQELWALLLLRRFGGRGLGEGASHAIDSLTNRVCHFLSNTAQSQMAEMSELVASPSEPELLVPEVWEAVTQALHRSLLLAFDDHPLEPSDLVQRKVEPWGLFCVEGIWYLHAFDQDRQAGRNFRLNRMQAPRLLNVKVARPERYSAEQAVFHRWNIGTDPDEEVVVECSPTLAAWLAENPVHPEQRLDRQRISFPINNRAFFFDWLLGQRGARLVSPEDLRQELYAHFRQRQVELFA